MVAERLTPAATGTASGALPTWATVDRIDGEADGVISISLIPPLGAEFPAWQPGAHIDIAIHGLERQYSLCGDPRDSQRWRIGVLREAKSRGGSEALHTRLRVGDELQVLAVRNHFPLIETQEYLLVAGGIGITPLLPMARQLHRGSRAWRMLYAGRTRASMAYRRELEAHGGHVDAWPKDERGPVDLATWIGPARPGCVVYCCGPDRMVGAVEAICATWPEDSLQVERFRPREGALEGAQAEFEVELAQSGITVTVAADQTIAAALAAVGVHVPVSCLEGTCGTCVTKVADGVPDHRDSFLRGRQRAENKKIMVCCSRSLTPRLLLDL